MISAASLTVCFGIALIGFAVHHLDLVGRVRIIDICTRMAGADGIEATGQLDWGVEMERAFVSQYSPRWLIRGVGVFYEIALDEIRNVLMLYGIR